MRHVWSDLDFAGLEVSHYRFEAAEQQRNGTADSEYVNEFVHLRGLGVVGYRRVLGTAAGGPLAAAMGFGRGPTPVHPSARGFLPRGVRGNFTRRQIDWELGYMGSHHQWDYSSGNWVDNRDAYTDKIKLGWTYAFLPTARVQFSVSHEVDLDRFGGGNVQFQMNF